ncbi:MAG: phosphatase PAP2 family protein [Acidimicrobiia bacterium]|nr:phosphatase PAP2 family protein [Acidimicrobiia bacterium]
MQLTSEKPADSPIGLVRCVDDAVDQIFDRLRGKPAADRFFYAASELGDMSLIWHIAGTARGLGPAGIESAVRQGLALGAESALVNGPVKSLFGRRRPAPADVERPHHLRMPRTSSFPSGHASSAFMAAGLLSERSSLGPIWYLAAASVASSRIYVRIHHGSDVVAGAALGVLLARGVRRLWPLGRWP